MEKKWTDERLAEFEKFERMLYIISSLNNANKFIEHVTEVIQIADALIENDLRTGKRSFLSFIRQQIIDEPQSPSNEREEG